MDFKQFVAVGLLLFTLMGCGPGQDGRFPVKGAVTFDGSPVADGSIMFVPKDSDKIKAGGSIVDGEYRIPAKHGLSPGRHTVEIVWKKPTGRKIQVDDPPRMVEEKKNVIPRKYNVRSELTVDINAGENTHNFQLNSK